MSTNEDKVHVSEQQLASSDQADEVKTKKRRGKGAKAKSSAAFNRSANQKFMAQQREIVQRRLGVFNQDAAQLEQSLKSMAVTVQPRSIPLPVATRGVGFTSVAEYSRLISAWNKETVVEICSIYQYYRVSLFLLAFKIYHSRYVQTREESFPLSPRFVMNEEQRQVLQTVVQVPLSMYNILCTVGVVEGEAAFHSYLPDQDLVNGQDVALYLSPFNIREALTRLADVETPQVDRRSFFDLNPLPGARWDENQEHGPLLLNGDQIWPEGYNVAVLQADIHAYSNLLTRAGNRLPKSFLVNFDWNSYGSKACTTCMYSTPSRLQAHFSRRIAPTTRKKTRQIDGSSREVDVVNDEYVYSHDVHAGLSAVVECWALDGTTTAMEMTTGVAAYVGEVERVQSRLQIQGRVFSHISPGNVLYKMVDAPRT